MNIDSGENRFNDCVYETSNNNPTTASVPTSYERTRTESVCPQVMRWQADRQVHTRIVREIACAVEISPSQVVAIVVTRQSFSKTRPSCNKSRASAFHSVFAIYPRSLLLWELDYSHADILHPPSLAHSPYHVLAGSCGGRRAEAGVPGARQWWLNSVLCLISLQSDVARLRKIVINRYVE